MSIAVPQSADTLWSHTATAAQPAKTLTEAVSADIAIIGAGFTGLTAAIHLAIAGQRVVVLEANEIGAGASGLNAGFVVPNFARADPWIVLEMLGKERGHRLLELVGRGADRLFENVRKFEIACDARQSGWLQPAHSPDAVAIQARRVEFWQSLGRPVRQLSREEIVHQTGMKIYHGGLLDESGGMVNPLSYVRGLGKAASGLGARIYSKTPVMNVVRDGGAWRLRTSLGHEVKADRVILATNAFGVGAARRMFQTIVPVAVYQIATEPMPPAILQRISPQGLPVGDTRSRLFTYRLDRDNRLISGGTAICNWGARPRLARAIAKRLMSELSLPHCPRIEYAWRGTIAVAPDYIPHVYEMGPGFIAGMGCNGRGLAATAMLGEVLASAALGTALTDLPVPLRSSAAMPFHAFSGIAVAASLLKSRVHDWREV